MESIILFFVSILSCTLGSVCGLGGGVIIKPVLDVTGIMGVSEISFLSGCTVLAMTSVSLPLNIRMGAARLDIKCATFLAIGAAVGGVLGKSMFQVLKSILGNENIVGITQAGVLFLITLWTLIYMRNQKSIKTRHYGRIWIYILIGLLLGIMSSFLGIGGGPINLIVLTYFFSLSTKDAALISLFIIMISQATSLMQVFVAGAIPNIRLIYLLLMVIGGVTGGILGSRLNKKLDEKRVNKIYTILLIMILIINIGNMVKFSILNFGAI